MAGKTRTKKAPTRGARTATSRVERVAAKRQAAGPTTRRAVKRTIKRKAATGPSARIKSVKPTAKHPLPEPIATFTF